MMKPVVKVIIAVILIAIVGSVYYSFLVPSDELGSFSKFSAGSEISQTINVAIVKAKGFERDRNGGIMSFYAIDKDNVEVRISLHEPAPPAVADAAVVELLGHMHADAFVASQVIVIK